MADSLLEVRTNAPDLVFSSLSAKLITYRDTIVPTEVSWFPVLCPYSDAIAYKCIRVIRFLIQENTSLKDLVLVDALVRTDRGQFLFGVRERTKAEELELELKPLLRDCIHGKQNAFRCKLEIQRNDFTVRENDQNDSLLRKRLVEYHIAVRLHNYLHILNANLGNPSYYCQLATIHSDTLDWLREGLDGASLLLEDHLQRKCAGEAVRTTLLAGKGSGDREGTLHSYDRSTVKLWNVEGVAQCFSHTIRWCPLPDESGKDVEKSKAEKSEEIESA